MMLVADEVDDEYPGLNNEVGANNENDDRSHLIQLEGSVLVSELAIADQSAELELRAQVEVEDTVHLNVIVFDVSNQTVEEVEAEIDGRVSEAFARVGIRVTADVNSANWNNSPVVPDEFRIWTNPPGGPQVPQYVKDMITAYSNEDEPDTINVFVVRKIRVGTTSEIAGVAFARSFTWEFLEEQYRTSVFVIGAAEGNVRWPWVLAHETGHMTTDKGHYGGDEEVDYPDPKPEQHKIDHNLMRKATNSVLTVLASKRLYDLEPLYDVQKGNKHKTPD